MIKRLSKSVLVIALVAALAVTGCSFTSAMTQLQKYLPIGLQAFEGVVQILVTTGVLLPAQATTLQNDATKVKAGFADVEAAVASYKSADAATKATKLDRVVTTLNVVQGELGSFLPDIGVDLKAKPVIVAQAVIVLLEGTLASIAVNLPAPASAATRASAAKVSVISANDFKKQFNAIVTNGGYGSLALR